MWDCPTCQDWHEVRDPGTGQVVACPDCCPDAYCHDCQDHAVEVGTRPDWWGTVWYWTECQVCGARLDTPTRSSVL